MQIKINGEPAEVEQGITVAALAEQKAEAPLYVSVALNGDFVDRKVFATTVVPEGAEVEFLYFMGGGRE